MRRLEVSGAVRPIYGSLGVKRLSISGIRYKSLKCSPFTGYMHDKALRRQEFSVC